VTTIATLGDGVVAADSQCTWDATVNRVTKLFRLPCGGVVGGCGTYAEIVRAVRWLRDGSKGKPPKIKTCDLLIAYGDGRTGVVSGTGWVFCENVGPVAIGSGMQAALVAMNHYADTAEGAVRAAASVDPNTSGPFQVMAVERKARASGRRKAK